MCCWCANICAFVSNAEENKQAIISLVLYILLILGCKHTLNYDNETEVEIKFPKSRYLDITSQSCSWEINYPPDYIISLNIISLDIPVNRSGHCNTQFLEISGIEGNASSIKLCGNVQQYKLQSQSNTTLIVLQLANNLTETTGFRLNFKGVLNRGRGSYCGFVFGIFMLPKI